MEKLCYDAMLKLIKVLSHILIGGKVVGAKILSRWQPVGKTITYVELG